jgi:hypothetical protein
MDTDSGVLPINALYLLDRRMTVMVYKSKAAKEELCAKLYSNVPAPARCAIPAGVSMADFASRPRLRY